MRSNKDELKIEILKTLDLIRENSTVQQQNRNVFSDGKMYASLYSFATEDLRGYYNEFGKPKTFLTVGSSGDQILNAVAIGAEKIDVFDLNKLSKRQCAQKIAAAKVLEPEILYEYFNSFSQNVYNDFRDKLLEKDRRYFDSLYDFYDEKSFNYLYPYYRVSKEMFYKINNYTDKDRYNEFQQKLESVEINYIDCDLYSLPNYLGDNTYDAMNFSNIYEYLNYGKDVCREKALKFYNFLMQQMCPRLNEDGKIMISYLYAFNNEVERYLKREMTEENIESLYQDGITFDQYQLYMNGFTLQNYSYILLLELLEQENIKKVLTSHVYFGQSFDSSNDMAIIYQKK